MLEEESRPHNRALSAERWRRLEERLLGQLAAIDGVVGVCVHDLQTGDGIAINGDVVFPTASTIKLHILTQLYLQVEHGDLDLAATFDSRNWHTSGSGVLTYLDDAPRLTLRDLATLMIIASDNCATNLCIDQVSISAVNAMLDDLALVQTRLRRKMMDADAGRAGEENVSTPVELVRMLRLLYHELPTAGAAHAVLEVLRKPKQGFINRALPGTLEVASKAGWSGGVRCDAGIVFQPRHPYALSIMLSFGMDPPEALDFAVVKLARTVHESMAQLAECNRFGHAVFV